MRHQFSEDASDETMHVMNHCQIIISVELTSKFDFTQLVLLEAN